MTSFRAGEWELNVVPSAELCLGEQEFGTSSWKFSREIFGLWSYSDFPVKTGRSFSASALSKYPFPSIDAESSPEVINSDNPSPEAIDPLADYRAALTQLDDDKVRICSKE